MTRASSKLVAPQSSIRLHLLGSFRIELDARTIHFPTRKVELLLAYLALHREAHAREKIAAFFWGDVPDELARPSLRTALFMLRKTVGANLLLTDRDTIQLNPSASIWVDACQFEQDVTNDPQSAIALYEGDLLLDFYDDWVLLERECLHAQYVATLLRLAQDARSQSQYLHAIEWAQRILENDPANEKAYQHIIFCLAALGDRTGALKQYDECAEKLEIELGVEPSEDTIALRDRIKQENRGSQSREALFTNLPSPLTSFIGRAKELAEIKQLLIQNRLLTLVGAGGCGKTRLAIEVAGQIVESFEDGVWWVDLAPLSDATLVPQSVAKSLGLREPLGQSFEEMLINYLRGKRLLLILDNCEHLITSCALLVETLLSTCPSLQILATSRETLGIMGEAAWRVPSLDLPDAEILLPVEQLIHYDAVRLFAERAKKIKPNWSFQDYAIAVTRICRRLDGIPLAIELAAARLTALSVDQIAMRLDDRFNLLASASRTALHRHQTLRSTIDWSYDLLSKAERRLLQRLSVFAGGWSLEAAESVCADNGIPVSDILNLLTHLVDQSLVIAETMNSAIRYRLLESIREYAREKLTRSGEMALVQQRHLDFFLRLSEEAECRWHGTEQSNWLDQLETEHENLRRAIEWSRENDCELGLRLASALWRFWSTRGYLGEGREQLASIMTRISAPVPPSLRAKALAAAGNMAYYQADYVPARALLEQSLAVRLEMEDDHSIGTALRELGVVTQSQGDYETARSLYEESIERCQKVGDQWGLMAGLSDLGQILWNQGDYAPARECFNRALGMSRALEDKAGVAYSLINLGLIACSEGNYDRMRALNEEGLRLYQELKDKWGTAHALYSLGVVAIAQANYSLARTYAETSLNLFMDYGDKWGLAYALQSLAQLAVAKWRTETTLSQESLLASGSIPLVRAAQLFGAAEALCKNIGAHIEPGVLALVEPYIAIARNQLGQEKFTTAWQEGCSMPLDHVLAIGFGRPQE
ncbi:MAG: AfsR/SARP family transcriptional regulator [Acidobacteriota bacterium]